MSVPTSGQIAYYDACALEGEGVIREIINHGNANQVIISHLALGEAYGNCLIKNEDIKNAFIKLVNDLLSFVKIVGNDGAESYLSDTQEIIGRISITDAMHIATALHHRCEVIRTRDRDFCGLDNSKLKELGEKYSIPNFAVSEIDNKPKSHYAKKISVRDR